MHHQLTLLSQFQISRSGRRFTEWSATFHRQPPAKAYAPSPALRQLNQVI
jgi:hypothetical protein